MCPRFALAVGAFLVLFFGLFFALVGESLEPLSSSRTLDLAHWCFLFTRHVAILLWRVQEQGDLKLRVRTLENERAFKRVSVMQETIAKVS